MPYQQTQTPQQMMELLAKPSLEEIEFTLRNHQVRGYKVDIETASTVMGNVQENQAQMNSFLMGASAFAQAAPALVQQGMDPAVLLDIFAGFSRNYRLGKAAEDGLDQLAARARQNTGQPKPPSPEQQKITAQLQIEREQAEIAKAKAVQEAQFRQQEHEMRRQEHEFKMAELQLEARIKMHERNVAERVGPDGEAQLMSVEAAQASDQNAMLQLMMQQQAASNDRIAAAMERQAAVIESHIRMVGRMLAQQVAREREPASGKRMSATTLRDADGRMSGAEIIVH